MDLYTQQDPGGWTPDPGFHGERFHIYIRYSKINEYFQAPGGRETVNFSLAVAEDFRNTS